MLVKVPNNRCSVINKRSYTISIKILKIIPLNLNYCFEIKYNLDTKINLDRNIKK